MADFQIADAIRSAGANTASAGQSVALALSAIATAIETHAVATLAAAKISSDVVPIIVSDAREALG